MKNRWLIAASAVGVHASIGSVYAYSVFKIPLEATFGWSSSSVITMFSIAIFFLGMSAAIMGHFVEKYGPRKSGTLAAIFFGGGFLIAGLGTTLENLYIVWLGYGVLGGIGLGIGYITPVSTLVKWFPDHRGLATGLAIMGFGFGAFGASFAFNGIMESISIPATFYIMGVVYLVVMLASASYLERPPEGWMPEGMKEAVASGQREVQQDLSQLTANEAVKTMPFYGLWIMMFINISCGIGVISAASPMAQESVGMTAAAGALMVALMSIFNGFGRIGWASFSDYLGRGNTYLMFFVIQIIAFVALPSIENAFLFQFVIFLVLSCYGGGFATLPAFIGDLFGTKQLGAIHGYILTAWAAAGLAGPQINNFLREATGSYETPLYIFAGAFVIALIVSLLMINYTKKARANLIAEAKFAAA